ncbi:MAG: UPF0280 family protein [archaeon]
MFWETFGYGFTKVKIGSDNQRFIDMAKEEIRVLHDVIREYAASRPEFYTSERPIAVHNAKGITRLMCNAAELAGVGPMAAVAGSISHLACKKMIEAGARNAVVDNGGDIYCYGEGLTIGVYSGINSLHLSFRLVREDMPLAICSSSRHLGHSISHGNTDLACVAAGSGWVADAFATALGNRVHSSADIDGALSWIRGKPVCGALVVIQGKLGFIGNLPEIIRNKDIFTEEKITRHGLYPEPDPLPGY